MILAEPCKEFNLLINGTLLPLKEGKKQEEKTQEGMK